MASRTTSNINTFLFLAQIIMQEFLNRVEAFEESKRASLQATANDGEMQVKTKIYSIPHGRRV